MQKLRLGFAGFYVFALLLLSVTVLRAAQKDASFVGSWERRKPRWARWRAVAGNHARRRQIQGEPQNAARRECL